MNKTYLLLPLLTILLVGCRKKEVKRTTLTPDENGLLTVKNEEDDFMLNYGIDPYQEVPCPEFESYEAAEAVFIQSGLNYCFVDFIANHPSSMDYSFEKLQSAGEMIPSIVDAPDKSFRVYSWNDYLGGTCTHWSGLCQIRDGENVYTYDGLPDWFSEEMFYVTDIFQLSHPTRNLYLIGAYYNESSAFSWHVFVAYERIGHELKRVPVIRDKEGELTDMIGFEYSSSGYYFNYAKAVGFDDRYYWDHKSQCLYFPELRDDESYLLTDRFYRYEWDGETLEPGDIVTDPYLHRSLKNFLQQERVIKINQLLVRIDSLADGRMRYASWHGDSMMAEPEIIVYGNSVGDEYRFYNNTYTYVVTKDEYDPEVRVYYSSVPGQLGKLEYTYKTDN